MTKVLVLFDKFKTVRSCTSGNCVHKWTAKLYIINLYVLMASPQSVKSCKES